MNNLQELEDKLAAAQAIVEKLKAEKEAAEKANQKYELQGGNWSLVPTTNQVSGKHGSATNWVEAGLERKTEALAESALKQIRAFSRMLAYVHEHCPEWEADWRNKNNETKYKVSYDHSLEKWTVEGNSWVQSNTVYMDRPTAIKLADDLNSGRFSLE
jgi:hypothetical protein